MRFSWKFRIANWLYKDVLRNWLAIDLAALDNIVKRTKRRNGTIHEMDIKRLKSIMGDIRGIMTGKRDENK